MPLHISLPVLGQSDAGREAIILSVSASLFLLPFPPLQIHRQDTRVVEFVERGWLHCPCCNKVLRSPHPTATSGVGLVGQQHTIAFLS